MTLHEVARLNAYWMKNPPLTMVVTAVAKTLGVEFKQAEKPRHMTAEEAMRLLMQTGGRIEGIGSV